MIGQTEIFQIAPLADPQRAKQKHIKTRSYAAGVKFRQIAARGPTDQALDATHLNWKFKNRSNKAQTNRNSIMILLDPNYRQLDVIPTDKTMPLHPPRLVRNDWFKWPPFYGQRQIGRHWYPSFIQKYGPISGPTRSVTQLQLTAPDGL